MKLARGFTSQNQVLSSSWTPPILKGVVQEGTTSYRAGLVIKDAIDIENLCSCRASRQWGTICAHSVAVGLHHLNRGKPVTPPSDPVTTGQLQTTMNRSRDLKPAPSQGPKLRRAEGAEGTSLELCVIIPPNFQAALTRGKVMVCFEGKWPGGRAPLDRLSLNTSFSLSAQDAELLDWIEVIAGSELSPTLLLSPVQFAALLSKLKNHPRVSLGRNQPITISDTPFQVSVRARLEPSGEIRVELSLPQKATELIRGEPSWVFSGGGFRPLPITAGCAGLLDKPLVVSRREVPTFLSRDWPMIQSGCVVDVNFQITDFQCEPQPPKFHLHLAGGIARLEAHLQCAYGPRIMTLGVTSAEESLWLPDPNSHTRYSTRDMAAEAQALGRLRQFQFQGPDVQGRLLLVGQNQVLTFLAREYPRLQREWSVTLEERLEKSTAQNVERIEPRLNITSSGEQWFDLDVAYGTRSGEKFSAAEIQRLVLSGASHMRLRNGKFAVIDTGAVEELQAVLLDCDPKQHAQGYRIDQAQAAYLDSTLQDKTTWQLAAPAAWRDRAARQAGQGTVTPPNLGDLENVLRPYQKQGVAWMVFLRENGFGGILADEMGLGKTLQALAFLRATKPALPTLIVCPTSLVFNWVNEAAKFTPSLKVLALQGPQRRALFQEISQANLVITSYALIRRDAELYRALEFDTVILDEAQHIKNRQSQNAQAVKSIRARHRLVLTGTPLENSVLDLWSIFDFLMPGYLGAAQDFRDRYEAPIVRDRNAEVQARLARRIRPFLLRRLKREVAKDLPERIEQVSYCDLTEDQRAVYQQVLQAGRKEAVAAAGQEGSPKSRMAVLNALLRLRQISCDLRLLDLENIDPASASGKLELFGELLEEVLDGGHRALVFSQFVSLLKLVEEQLKAEGIEYCYLDGSTRDRAAVVNRFQNTASIPVFLISLKAGGTGLNLTGADTVIHLDPWWNPAVEDQATDRAHRIGQTRIVTSYKLIARGTVEEKILKLQERKRELIRNTLTGEEEFAASLSWSEIQGLLAGD